MQEHDNELELSPWNIQTMQMFNMSTASGLFLTKGTPAYEQALKQGKTLVPLYEGKLFHQFDHRYNSYEFSTKNGKLNTVNVPLEHKQQLSYSISPQYWVETTNVQKRLNQKQWTRKWVLVWRDIARATDERTVIASALPAMTAVGGTANMIMPDVDANIAACLLAMLNSLVVDYLERIKQSGIHTNLAYLKQLPILPPEAFKEQDVAFICERVAKLTRTADDINEVWLTDYPAYTFQGPEERLQIRCELDAYIARMYGLTREELHYILDPADAMNDPTFPSVTFPGLKNKEIKLYGEYRTQRLVLKAFDDLEAGTLK